MKSSEMLRNAWNLMTGNGFDFSFDRIPLRHDRLDRPRTVNLFKTGLDHFLRSARMSALPPVVQIEPTNVCNLACPLCPSQTMQRPKGMMTLETFDAILRGIGRTQLLAILYGWGEPFLNANLHRMIARCRDNGILTLTSTNGHCLQSPDEALNVVDAGLSALIMAMDGTTQESYGAYRLNGTLERVLRCVENVQEAKARRNSSLPFTNLRLVANRHNEEQIETMEAMARDLGVDMFSVKSLGCLPDRPAYKSFEPHPLEIRRFRPGQDRHIGKTGFHCAYPFRQPTIFWDGTLVGCEFDYELGNAWGNVNTEPFPSIWNSPRALEHRKSLRRGVGTPSFCTSCPYSGRGRNGSIVYSARLSPARPL